MKKSKTRIFVNKTISSNLLIYIKDKQHHFLKNVLRIKVNDEINVFDSITGEWKSILPAANAWLKQNSFAPGIDFDNALAGIIARNNEVQADREVIAINVEKPLPSGEDQKGVLSSIWDSMDQKTKDDIITSVFFLIF